MTQDELKQAVARAALDYVKPKLLPETIIGIGTGSTTNYFIDLLAAHKALFDGAVASSEATAKRLTGHGIPVYDLNNVDRMSVYVDGADEANARLQLIKGGGAALTREKIVAAVADEFVCIADASKYSDILGGYPLPIEVIPMARSYVARQIVRLGGEPVYRQGVVTDNGNVILDVYNFAIPDPLTTEASLNNIVGVVASGLFARRPADVLFLGGDDGVRKIDNPDRI